MTERGFRYKKLGFGDRAYIGSSDSGGYAAHEDSLWDGFSLGYSDILATESCKIHDNHFFVHAPHGSSPEEIAFSKLGVVRYAHLNQTEHSELETDNPWYGGTRLFPFGKTFITKLVNHLHSGSRLADRMQTADLWERAGVANLKLCHSQYGSVFIHDVDDTYSTMPFAQTLAQYRNIETPEELGNLLHLLLEARPVSELENWFVRDWQEWLSQKRLSLAVVLEAAVQLGVPGMDRVLTAVLTDYTTPSAIASVAAQRVRMVVFLEQQVLTGLWPVLKRWFELWISRSTTEQYAVFGLPSGLYTGHEEAVEWFSRLIEGAEPQIAAAAAVGILNAMQNETLFNATTGQRFTRAILNRLDSEIKNGKSKHELFATLVWTLGATVTECDLPRAADILVHSFREPLWTEDAAAVRAGRLLYWRLGLAARRIIASKFGGMDSEICHRFEMAIMRPAFTR